MDDRVERGEAGLQRTLVRDRTGEQFSQDRHHFAGLGCRFNTNPEAGYCAPYHGAVRAALAADVWRGVGLRNDDATGTALAQQGRERQGAEVAGQERQNMPGF